MRPPRLWLTWADFLEDALGVVACFAFLGLAFFG